VSLDTLLWFAGIATEALLIVLLLYRHLWRTLPVFILYISFALVGDLVTLVAFRGYGPGYTTWYLTQTILDSILLFGVLVELAWSILRPVRASLSRHALIPVVGLILVAGAAVWPFASLSGIGGGSGKQHFIAQLQQTVSILQVVFFLALIASSQLFSIGWRDREMQVATGLGFFSFVSIATAALAMHQTSFIQYRHLLRIEIGADICSMIYWVVSFAQKEAERREFTPQMQSFLLTVAGAAHSSRVALSESRSEKARKSGKP
jgi:hypothetical protein